MLLHDNKWQISWEQLARGPRKDNKRTLSNLLKQFEDDSDDVHIMVDRLCLSEALGRYKAVMACSTITSFCHV